MLTNIGRISPPTQHFFNDASADEVNAVIEEKHVTGLLTLLNMLLAEVQDDLSRSQKQNLKELKSKVRKNGDDSKFQYDRKAVLNLASAAMSSCLSLASTSLFPGRDSKLLETIQTIFPQINASAQTWIDGLLSRESSEAAINNKEIEELQQKMQGISGTFNEAKQAVQAGLDGERRALSR